MAKTLARGPSYILLPAAALIAAVAAGCGGGSSGASATGTNLAFSVAWEQPAGTVQAATDDPFESPIPPSVSAIRFIFRPATGAACCIAVIRGSDPFIERRIQLANVGDGLGSLEVHGFPANFAPSDGVSETCATRPIGEGDPCSGDETLPSFGSDDIPVDVIPGITNVVNVEVHSIPFLLDLDPADGETVTESTPTISFAVVDANHPIDPDELLVRLSQDEFENVANLSTEECRDNDSEFPDCSDDGELEVQGYLVEAVPQVDLPDGVIDLHIEATNEAPDEPQSMVSDTGFIVDTGVTTTTVTSTTETSTSTTAESTTTTTLTEPPATFCLQFSQTSLNALVGLSYNVTYGNSDGEFDGSGENVECFSELQTNPESTLVTFNDDEETSTLSTAIAAAQTFSSPSGVTPLATCFFLQVPPLDLGNVFVQVTEATAPDLTSVSATVSVEDVQCPQ